MDGTLKFPKSGIDRQSNAYVTAVLATFIVGGLIAYSWTSAVDNWFKIRYPNDKDSVQPRFISAAIITVIAIIALKLILRVRKL